MRIGRERAMVWRAPLGAPGRDERRAHFEALVAAALDELPDDILALLDNVAVVVADEPTASLDATSGARVIELLVEGARSAGATLLAVTHDPDLIAAVGTVHRLERGRLDRVR